MFVPTDLLNAVAMGWAAIGMPPTALPGPEVVELWPLVQVVDLRVGSGTVVEPGALVTLHFRVWNETGRELADTRKRGLPFTIPAPEPGTSVFWESALRGLRSGGRREVLLPAHLAYASEALAPVLPTSGFLRAEVEVVAVVTAAESGLGRMTRR